MAMASTAATMDTMIKISLERVAAAWAALISVSALPIFVSTRRCMDSATAARAIAVSPPSSMLAITASISPAFTFTIKSNTTAL